MGRKVGIDERQLLELSSYAESSAFSPLERAVLEYATRMSRTPVEIPPELAEALGRELGPAELVELSAAIAWENFRARFNHALGVPADGFSEGAVCALPARASPTAASGARFSTE